MIIEKKMRLYIFKITLESLPAKRLEIYKTKYY